MLQVWNTYAGGVFVSRQLKPQEMSTWCSGRHGFKAVVYLDRNHKDFYASIGTHQVRHATHAGVENKLYALAEQLAQVSWERVICVNNLSYECHFCPKGAQVVLAFKRFWLGRRQDGNYLELPFDKDPAEPDSLTWANHSVMVKDKVEWPLTYPYLCGDHRASDGKYYLLQYDEVVWARLEHLSTLINALRQQLAALVSSKEGLAQLVASSHQLLPMQEVDGDF